MSAKSGFMVAPGTGIRQPVSNPGEPAGYTTAPAFVLTDAYTLRAACSWAAVRQSGPSPALQASAAGLNVQLRGLLTMPSFTPSFSSHAFTTALANNVTFSRGTMREVF